MKKFIVVSLVIFVSCNNGGGNSERPPMSPDTTKPLIIYELGKEVKFDVAIRIARDSVVYDSTKKKLSIQRVKNYWYPFYDSLRDKVGKPIKDSVWGKYSIIVAGYVPLPNQFVIRDMNLNTDSLMKAKIKDTLNKKEFKESRKGKV